MRQCQPSATFHNSFQQMNTGFDHEIPSGQSFEISIFEIEVERQVLQSLHVGNHSAKSL